MRTTIIPGTTTKPCSKCKIVKDFIEFSKNRITKDGLHCQCKSCQKNFYELNKHEISKRRKLPSISDKVKRSEYGKNYRKLNKDRLDAQKKLYVASNIEKVIERKLAYRLANPKKVADGYKSWQQANPDKVCARNARRRVRKLQAFPQWAQSGEHKDAIDAVYSEAKRLEVITGIPHHVDHTHPLQHPLVCGLHVAANLRVITATENLRKNNKFVPYVESEL